MKLCDQCLSEHPELCTSLNHPYDIGMCEDCLQVCLVRFVFEIEPRLLPKQEDVTDIEIGDGTIRVIEITSENREALTEMALSAYLGEKCVYCRQIFTTLESLKTVVFAPGGIACKVCWDQFGKS